MNDTAQRTSSIKVVRDTYADSLLLLVATQEMSQAEGVSWAGAVMATPTGRESLESEGFDPDVDGPVGSNDLVFAVRAENDDALARAFANGLQAIEGDSAGDEKADGGAAPAPRSVAEAVEADSDLNVAVISVPGAYAALETHHALTEGLHVLLFSDNVPLEEEIELKDRANKLGLLVMGPGAGTAVLSGTGLGFANELRRGPVGVIAAAGTGAQEVSTLLERWDVGVSHVIGVGGRDLSEQVAGRMTLAAVRALDADPDTTAILLVSKPPNKDVAMKVLSSCGSTPAVATFLGAAGLEVPQGVETTRTLEAGARAAAALVGQTPPASPSMTDEVERAIAALASERRVVRGYYSGGTLCYEAQLIISELAGEVYSNEPLVEDNLASSAPAGAHVLLDLGAEEYTEGRPHPMIDPSLRLEIMREGGRDREVAAVLIDVVIGHGAHADPAGELAPVCAELMADGGPQVIAYVLGSSVDPQDRESQIAKLRDVGCIVPETAAQAALAAAAIASRRVEFLDGADV